MGRGRFQKQGTAFAPALLLALQLSQADAAVFSEKPHQARQEALRPSKLGPRQWHISWPRGVRAEGPLPRAGPDSLILALGW